MGLFVPGTTLFMAKATSRNSFVQSATEEVCELHSKSRPTGEFRKWTTLSRFDESQPVPCYYDTFLAGSANTDVIPRTRVCSLEPVLLLCGSQRRACTPDCKGPSPVSLPVPCACNTRDASASP